MSAEVSAVPNSSFSVGPLVTSAPSVVSRRKVKIYPTRTGWHSPNTNNYPSTIQFDIADAESFLDTESLELQGRFWPKFFKGILGAPDKHGDWYNPDESPVPDGGNHALVAAIRIGNMQGLVIEEIVHYNLYVNMMNSITETMTHKAASLNDNKQKGVATSSHGIGRHSLSVGPQVLVTSAQHLTTLLDYTPRATSNDNGFDTPREFTLKFSHASILNRIRMIPLFLMRQGLRIEINLERPELAFYTPTLYGCLKSGQTITCKPDAADTKTVEVERANGDAGSIATVKIIHNRGTTAGYVKDEYIVMSLNSYGKPAFFVEGDITAIDANSITVKGKTSFIQTTANADLVATKFADLSAINTGVFNPAAAASARTVADLSDIYGIQSVTIYERSGFNTNRVRSQDPAVWDYKMDEIVLICDMVKPSSENRINYESSFNSPSGIMYPFTRIAHYSGLIKSPASGTTQIVVPFGVRALKALLVVITDPLVTQIGNDSTVYGFPCKSSFQMRNLVEASLQVGATTFPTYRQRFDHRFVTSHLNELWSIFQNNRNWNYEGAHAPVGLDREGTDYHLAAWAPLQNNTADSDGFSLPGFNRWTQPYLDTSHFVLGFNTSRVDGDFLSGVDCTQSGSVILNLNFGQPIHFSKEENTRDMHVHIFGLCDAVFTLQRDASAIRY